VHYISVIFITCGLSYIYKSKRMIYLLQTF